MAMEPSSSGLTVIDDTLEASAYPLINWFTTVKTPQHPFIYCNTETRHVPKSITKNHDWRLSALDQSIDVLLSELLDSLPTKSMIIMESINPFLLAVDGNDVRVVGQLARLLNHEKLSSLVVVVHADALAEDSKLLAQLHYLATSHMSLTMCPAPLNIPQCIHTVVKASNKLQVKTYTYSLDRPSLTITDIRLFDRLSALKSVHQTPFDQSPSSAPKISNLNLAPKMPTSNLPPKSIPNSDKEPTSSFKMSLTEEEKKLKDSIPLPYTVDQVEYEGKVRVGGRI